MGKHAIGERGCRARLHGLERVAVAHREHGYGGCRVRPAPLAADLGRGRAFARRASGSLPAQVVSAAERPASRLACVRNGRVERLLHAGDALLVVDHADGSEHHGQHHGHGGHVECDELEAQLLQHDVSSSALTEKR